MLKTIKRISLDDYNHLAIVFDSSDILKYGIAENDKLDLDLLEQEIKHGIWINNNATKPIKSHS